MSDERGEIAPNLVVRGFKIYENFLEPDVQKALVADIRQVATQAPLFIPTTPRGQSMSVRMTSAGRVGWVSDSRGYRYDRNHPTGALWPAIPRSILDIWNAVGPKKRQPDCCLINFYDDKAKMGMHQDKDEQDFSWPVVSVSLGDDALFRIGNTTRGGKTESLWLKSGDVVVMGGDARLAYHGVDRLRHGSSMLLPKGGRLNLTLRVVGGLN